MIVRYHEQEDVAALGKFHPVKPDLDSSPGFTPAWVGLCRKSFCPEQPFADDLAFIAFDFFLNYCLCWLATSKASDPSWQTALGSSFCSANFVHVVSTSPGVKLESTGGGGESAHLIFT